MPRKRSIVIGIVAFVTTATAMAAWLTSRQTAIELEEVMINPTGWEWLMEPREIGGDNSVRAMWLSEEASLTVIGSEDNQVYASVTRPIPPEQAELKTAFRLIEIMETGERERGHAVTSMWGPTTGSIAVYRLGHRKGKQIRTRWVGLEVCRPEGKRLIAREAAAEAAAAGIAVPPLPEIGKPYAFEFTDVGGSAIRSADLRSKVVLLNIWASWCGPCMAKLPLLKEVYEQYHARGLEIVAISLDRDVADAVRVYAERDIEWPLVFVPTDERTRDLWRRATDTYGIPRVLLIDREGVMRGDLHGTDLAKRVAAHFETTVAVGGSP